LVTQALAAAGGENGQGRAAFQQTGDDVGLSAAEIGEAENFFNNRFAWGKPLRTVS
jgi:hypothetical protein